VAAALEVGHDLGAAVVTPLGALVDDPQVRALLATLGTPYHWNRGTPAMPWPPGPSDCSGYAQAALVMLGLLRPTEPDRRAFDLAMVSSPVQRGEGRLGDLAFYGAPVSHVMVCLGNGWVIGPRGGGSKTFGDNPGAYVDIKPLMYRGDFVVIGRLRPELAP
jgi:cell wall-associated NlpC family hydrolase